MRLFVAIELDPPIRAALAEVQDQLRGACEGVRWIPAEQLHVTMKFLGEVSDKNVAGVADALRRAARSGPTFSMEVAGSGCFPPRGPARIVWVGMREQTGAMRRCVDAVEQALEPLGFPRERRPFSGHITVGRIREDRSSGRIRGAAEACTFESVTQAVDSITLMSSVLSPKGPIYSAVVTARLG